MDQGKKGLNLGGEDELPKLLFGRGKEAQGGEVLIEWEKVEMVPLLANKSNSVKVT